MLYRSITLLLRIVFRLFSRVEITGLNQIPQNGPVVIAANHISNFDPLVIAAFVKRPLYFVAKVELFKYPIGAFFLKKLHAIPIKRGTFDRFALVTINDLLMQGKAILIFPEGTRIKTGEVGGFHPGASMFALRSQAALVPMAVVNTHKLFPMGFWQRVYLRIGAAIELPERTAQKISSESHERVSARLREEVVTLTGNVASTG